MAFWWFCWSCHHCVVWFSWPADTQIDSHNNHSLFDSFKRHFLYLFAFLKRQVSKKILKNRFEIPSGVKKMVMLSEATTECVWNGFVCMFEGDWKKEYPRCSSALQAHSQGITSLQKRSPSTNRCLGPNLKSKNESLSPKKESSQFPSHEMKFHYKNQLGVNRAKPHLKLQR